VKSAHGGDEPAEQDGTKRWRRKSFYLKTQQEQKNAAAGVKSAHDGDEPAEQDGT